MKTSAFWSAAARERRVKRRGFLFKWQIRHQITRIRALMPISLLVVARRQPENATFSSEPCREGPVFGSDSENSLFEAELKFCTFTPKKYFAHSGFSSIRDSRKSEKSLSEKLKRQVLSIWGLVAVQVSNLLWNPPLSISFCTDFQKIQWLQNKKTVAKFQNEID